jgi:hypothetical protein
MSSWLGYRNIDDLLTFAVNTHSASTGAATDADAVPSYRVYEDETGTAILTGSMAKLDDTNTTGFYSEQLTLSAANGFEAGKCYSVYISAAVGSVTGTTERHFSVWPAAINSTIGADVVKISGDSVAADNLESYTDGTIPMPVNVTQISGDTTAADNLELATDGGVYNVGGGGIVASSVTGNVGGNVTGSVGSVTGNVGGNVVGSVASVTGNLGGNVVGSVASVTGNVGGNVVGSVASVTGNVLGSVNSVVSDVTLANNNVNANTVSDTAAQEIANAVWTANIAQTYSVGGVPAANWANNTFGDRVVISDSNNQNEVAITGSNHIAADIHEIQSQEIIDIAQGVLTEATSTNTATYAVGDVGNVLGRLVNMIAADGADFQFTANALELAPSGGGGGGGSTTVRMGPFVIKAEGQGSEEPLDINKGATHAIECQLVDAEGTGVDITGATLTAKVYNSAGSLIETVSGTISYAALGQVRWTIGTTTTNTAGTYTVTITRTTGASDTQIFGPLRVYVRDI